jgi:predicted HicB family RNase H-like nuclease
MYFPSVLKSSMDVTDLMVSPKKINHLFCNVCIGPNLHQRVAHNALSKGITINKYINGMLEKAVQDG